MASEQELVERESLKDLRKLVERTREWGIITVVIGGYAVRAYTNAYRYTKDIDLAVAKEEHGNFLALLKSLNYTSRHTDFGVAASKKFNSDFIDVHISVGRIVDISTGLFYPITKELFDESKTMAVRPRFEGNKGYETEAPVVNLSTLIILKFLPKGRPEKDGVDVLSLILDRSGDIDLESVANKCQNTDLTRHMMSQVQALAQKLNTGEMARLWSRVTGTAMSATQTRVIQKFLRSLDRTLRT